MKTLFFFAGFLFFVFSVNSQNTFPSSGNVGIGTSTPSSKLEVKSSTNTNSEIHINTTTAGDKSIIRFQDAGTATWGFLSNYPVSGKFSLYNYQNNSNALILDQNGKVGIGTTNPSSMLHVAGNLAVIKLQDSDHNYADNGFNGWLGGYDMAGQEVWWLGEGSGNDKVLGFYVNKEGYDLNLKNNGNGIVIKEGGNVGIGTETPSVKLQVNGASEVKSANIVNFGTLSDSDYVTSNTYRSFSGSTYTDGFSGNIGKYFSYRSIYGGYSNYNGGGVGFYSQGHYPRMFMEIISGNHGTMAGLPSDSPIKNGYIYQQIKGPEGNQLGTPIKATKDNSQWLWGVSAEGNIIVAGKIESREVKVTVNAGADFVFEDNYNLPSLEEVQQFIQENGHLPDIASAKDMEENGIHLSEMNIKLLQKIEELTLYVIEQEEKIKTLENKLEKVDELEKRLIELINKK